MEKIKLLIVFIFLLFIFTPAYSQKKKKPAYNAENIQQLLVDAKGKPWTKSKLADKKYILLYFSAHWCPPCRAFTPKLVKFYNENNKGEFEVILIDGDYSAKEMRKYMEQMSMPWPAIKYDMRGRSNLRSYAGGRGIPCLVILNQKGGKILGSYTNGEYTRPSTILDKLEELLAEDKSSPTKKKKAKK